MIVNRRMLLVAQSQQDNVSDLRLKKWHIRSSYQAVLIEILPCYDELSDYVIKLHPKQVKERAAVIYRKASKGSCQRSSISAIAAASLYAACRVMHSRTLVNLLASVN